MRDRPLLAPFLWALLPFLLSPSWLPLIAFAPFLVIVFYRRTRFRSLWFALLAGLIVDLFSSGPFGLHAVTYAFVTFFLHSQRRNFFEDKLSTLPILTGFFTLFAASITPIFAAMMGTKTLISWRWILTDLVGISLLNTLYAFLWFSLPFQLTHQLRKILKHGNPFRKSDRG